MPAMMTNIMNTTTINGSTARGASSPVKQSSCVNMHLVHTDLPTGLPTKKGNTKRCEEPAKRALHIILPESTMSAPLSFFLVHTGHDGDASQAQTTTEGNTARKGTSTGKQALQASHCRCRRRERPQEEREEVRGVRLFLLFFLFFIFLLEEAPPESNLFSSSRQALALS